MIGLPQIAIFLGSALVVVPLLKRFGLATVLGYLATGLLLGHSGFGIMHDAEGVMHVAEYGVVMLLFIIGLELEPARLWVLRRSVFGLGSLQMVVTGLLFTGIGISLGYSHAISVLVGFGLAMSSTAFILQLLAEKNQLSSQHGREAFAILLFQDMAVIPLLAIIPLLGGKHEQTYHLIDLAQVFAVFGSLIIFSRFLIRPVFRLIASAGASELFTGVALFIVIGVSLLMQALDISMTLGAFLAGVLLADSEYRHELEASIQPFKGLLLGLFFIAVGMTADLEVLFANPLGIMEAVLVIIAVKLLALALIGRLFGNSWPTSLQLGASLAQGGEFAFVLFTAAFSEGLLPRAMVEKLTLIVTISMAMTPLIIMLIERFVVPRFGQAQEPRTDAIEDHGDPVIIAGFGRFGQIVARVLRMHHIGFTALEANARQVDFVRRFGSRVYYGNPANIDLLYAAGLAKAKVFVLAMDDVNDSVRTAEAVRRHFPKLAIYARARDRNHAYQLMEVGVKIINRETYLSSLDLARKVMVGLGMSEERAARGIKSFQRYDEGLLLRQQAVYQDEARLAETVKQSMQELEDLFEADEKATRSLEAAENAAEPPATPG